MRMSAAARGAPCPHGGTAAPPGRPARIAPTRLACCAPSPLPARSRRFNNGGFDVESMERENDRGIDALSDRIGLLKQARARAASKPA